MKQRVEELERLQQTVATVIRARSTALADTQRLVAKLEYTLRATSKSLADVRDHDLMKRQGVDIDLVSRTAEHRKQIEVSLSATSVQSNLAKGRIAVLSPFAAANRFVRLDPIRYMVPWTDKNQRPKRHLDRFSRFCTAHAFTQHTSTQTDRHTDHATCDICSSLPYLIQCAVDAACL